MSNKPVKIFLVEDDLSFGSVLKSYLEINDYSVEWVDDGKYAIDHFRKNKTVFICSFKKLNIYKVKLNGKTYRH